jgi:hypothetical protein
MALGFTELRNEALKLLNETNTSVVGELATGVGLPITSATVSIGNPLISAVNSLAVGDQVRFITSTVTNIIANKTYTVSATNLSGTGFQLVGVAPASLTPTGGTGGTFTVVGNSVFSDETICTYINEAAKEMARSCVWNEDSISINTSTRVTTFADKLLWHPLTVKIGSSLLIHCGEMELRSYDLGYTSTTGTPTYWYRSGNTNIGLYPAPTSAIDIVVTGGVMPATISTDPTSTVTLSIAPDDILLKAIPAYVAGKLAFKNYDDPSLVGRAFWKDWYDLTRMQLWAQQDTSLKLPGCPYGVPPIPQSQK